MKNYIAAKCVFQLLWISAFLVVLAYPSFGQQSQPGLQITSPANGTLINAGQTISVTVTSPANLTFTFISVLGPGGPAYANTSVPATFSLTIPANTAPKKYGIAASGKTSAGNAVFSAPVDITIERPDKPVTLTTNPPTYYVRQGDFDYLKVSGRFSDGSTLDVTESTYMSFSSSNTAIVTVNAKGLVGAVAVGSATVTATYSGGPSRAVPVFVTKAPVTPSPTSLSFGSQNIGTTSTAQTVTFTNSTNNPSLSVTAVGASGDYSETDDCVASSPLAVGATCSASVTFAPSQTGSRVGYLNTQTNMMATPVGIELDGTGSQSPSAPTISSLDPVSGPIGASVTVSGTNFGSSQGTSAVSFNGTPAQPASWSTTGIVATVPNGATTGNVTVTVSNQPSNAASFIVSTPAPSLSGLSPPSGVVATSVTISGTSFGASQGTSAVAFHGTVATPTNWSSTSIAVPVPAAATTGNVYVTVGGQPSNGLSFVVTPTIARSHLINTSGG